MSGLSEKAKGKRRATEPDGDERAASVPQGRPLTIRFSEGIPDLHLVVGPSDNVRQIQRKIRNERPSLARRRLRLIHSGRLLTNGTLVHGWLTSLEERQNRALVRGIPTAPDNPATSAAASGGIWLHCSVGPEMPEGELDDDKVQTSQLTPLRGFDRLASAGFTAEDIADVRHQFHISRGIGGEGDAHPPDGALQENLDDEGARILILITILAVEGPSNVIFSKRMLMAVCVGFISNVAYGTLRTFTV
ncbi:hypothetical protein BS47DRAFT_1340811 [Hydnum rufescens UP504]|uniref:Ubiquitin-like domain-containing protein n=1 Tax=Hydnum rufescens UP504 TaxID=1448309 RepID=A0A9P6DZ88_9AGAM|nr:hypothetical protein BS47DRAFT_1340811 [Hydnum rufescens UP504]